MITEHCGIKGCEFKTSQETTAVARRVLGNHKRRIHGIVGASVSAQWKAKQGGLVRNSGEAPTQTPQPQQPEFYVNMCPNCGCPIRAVAVAINMRRKA